MSSLTEVTLQLIYKKLEEILAAIKGKEKPIAMEKVMKVVNKKKP